jgi:thioredoxin-related protein
MRKVEKDEEEKVLGIMLMPMMLLLMLLVIMLLLLLLRRRRRRRRRRNAIVMCYLQFLSPHYFYLVLMIEVIENWLVNSHKKTIQKNKKLREIIHRNHLEETRAHEVEETALELVASML